MFVTVRLESAWHRVHIMLLLVLSMCAGCFAFQDPQLSPVNYKVLGNIPANSSTLPVGFKQKYVDASGIIYNTKPSGNTIEIAASPKVSERGHYDAALTISHMTRHMPSFIFARLSMHATVGVFTRSEKLTIYPEFRHLANTPECQHRCDGHCRRTCTFDGRKYETLAGLGGERAAILDDNVMCTSRDPYRHRENILVHEFAHTIHHHGLNYTTASKIKTAYSHAKSHVLWVNSAYSMVNHQEYFAAATTSWYNVNQGRSAGKMNMCGTSSYCLSESEARKYIHSHDSQLYHILNHVYNNGDDSVQGEITTCIEQTK